MSKLENKVAIVTGASKGIGAGIAKAYAQAGAKVVVNYASSKEDAEQVVKSITENGGTAIAIHGDVSKSSDVARLFEEAKNAFGTVDILVNNAGVYQGAPIEGITEEGFHQQFNINVLGSLLTIKEAVAQFGNDGGTIINISSVVSTLPLAMMSIYSATKAALDSITVSLSKEFSGRNIRINSILPGGVQTEGTVTAGITGSDMEKTMIANTPLGRIGQPDDIAKVAVFLASDDATWINGEKITVSGGIYGF
ncbi:glucose 1-dehydrogenase [Arcicella sp. LKC2W]|uniref:SDR family NAD(P)-dependent oxidoreductase n=1 Tax=Arcicella sp. LKC2W TaxID=2984198 RepID=UPI002B20E2E5|nr:glucose 1-dehydrogenase [Arcicella sp. LKC2W]MEA5461717.1 glucose 1-dehydrogenase [Arcicella sp. LKC2W]